MRKKLRSQRGIAMIFAIVAFVVVMVLGTVVYTAGYANYSKLFGRKASRQTYFTLISTAKLLKDELNGAQIIVEETWKEPTDESETLSRVFSYYPEQVTTNPPLAQQILEQLAEGEKGNISLTVNITKGSKYSDSLSLTVADIELDHELDETDPAYKSTRETTFTLSCDGREVVVDGNFAPSYLTWQTAGETDGETVFTSQTKYTLTIGEIHEKD